MSPANLICARAPSDRKAGMSRPLAQIRLRRRRRRASGPRSSGRRPPGPVVRARRRSPRTRGWRRSPLDRGERRADVVLQLGQAAPKAREVALDDRGEESQQDQPAEPFGDPSGDGGSSANGLDFLGPVEAAWAAEAGRAGPTSRPGTRAGRAGGAAASSSGGRRRRSGRRGRSRAGRSPSVGRARRARRAARRDGSGRPAELQSSRATARLSCVPTPRPTCSAGADERPRSAPADDVDPRLLRASSDRPDEPAATRARAAPRTVQLGAGSATSSMPGASIIRPTPPNWRGAAGPSPGGRSEAGSESGCEVGSWCVSWSGSRPRCVRERCRTCSCRSAKAACSAGPPVLSTRTAELANSARISSPGQDRGPGRQDGRLDHGVLGAVEAEEVAEPALGHRLDHDRRPLVAVVELDRRGTRSSGRRRRGSGPRRRRPAGSAPARAGRPIAVRASSRTSSVTWKTPSPRAFRFR